VCDDEEAVRVPLVRSLARIGHDVTAFEDGKQALSYLQGSAVVDLVITDIRMPELDGIDLLREVKTRRPDTPVVLITGFASISTSFEAGRLGADAYLEKPIDIHDLRRKVTALLERDTPHEAPDEVLPGVIARSASMRALADRVRQAAPTPATVLVLGESGTGKDLIAHALHDLSLQREGPFLPLNCAAIPAHLLESELFGHERGAFTGAVTRQVGKFEVAKNGTLFLDEIGELAPDLQAKLLRVLEERTFTRVGGSTPLSLDARLIAASNREMEGMVRDGKFRMDLYYRLKVVSLDVPPLREREGDVELLAQHFLRGFAEYYSKGAMSYTPEALALLSQSRWEGNIRELRNLVESLVVLSRGGTIDVADLPPAYRNPRGPGAKAASDAASAAVKTMSEIERDAILQALRETGGNRERAARKLNIGLRTLQRKIKEYRELGIDI
jgi:DNA-binding NtrC family response regulator